LISSITGYSSPTFKLSFTIFFSSHNATTHSRRNKGLRTRLSTTTTKKGLRTNDVNFICGQEKCLKGVVRVLKVKARLVNIHNTLLVNTIVLVVITT
jgi:hypothetical protein